MFLHSWRHQGPHKPSSCAPFMLSPHWGRAATGKRDLHVCTGSPQFCPTLCDPAGCGLPGFSVTGVLQARILECIGQYLMPYPSRSLYFLLPWPPNPEYLVLPEPLGPKQLHHLHTWPSPGQTHVLQGSLRSKPQWKTRMQSWNI